MQLRNKLSVTWKFSIAILLCESVGIISGLLASANNNVWFDSLIKPTWNPPAYLFGPVWTTLYLFMGISLALIWKNKATEIKNATPIFIRHTTISKFLVEHFLFHFHSPTLALVDIVLMIITILLTIFSFSSFSKTASWLLVPYIAWVSFATILNFSIWNLNH